MAGARVYPGGRVVRPGSAPATNPADAFVISVPASGTRCNLFAGTQDLTLPTTGHNPATINVFGDLSRIARHYDTNTDRAIYLMGRAVHPSFRAIDQLLPWCAQIGLSDQPASLRDLLGTFVIMIDDRRTRRVTFISDVLGVRPWFVGAYKGNLVAGSDVLRLCKAGLSHGRANYDAIASWLRYNFPVNNAAIVDDLQHLEPASLCTFDAHGVLESRRIYGSLEFGRVEASQDDAIDASHDAISHSLDTQLRDLDEVNFPLSGGYDSRLLFALARRSQSPRLHLATLHTRDYEVDIAKQVAKALNHPLEVIHSGKRILDLFDDPFAFTPGGFITGRNLTNQMARRLPGMPMVTGFLGDGTMRGSMLPAGQAYFARDLPETSAAELTQVVDKRYTYHSHRLNLLRDAVRKRITARATANLQSLVEAGRTTARPLLYSDMFGWQRSYYANIFLQPLDVAESITPYVNWRTMNCRVRYASSCFTGENYPRLFAKYFPLIAGITHSFFAPGRPTEKRKAPVTRHLRRFSAELAAGLLLTDVLEGAKKRTIFGLLPSGLLSEPLYQEEIKFLYKLMLFERSLRKHHIEFDWNAL